MEGLGINLPVLLAQLINFFILLVLLYFAAYKPIIRMLDQRSAKIKEGMEQAEAIRQKTAQTEEEVRAQLEAARKEGQAVIAQATQIGDRLKEEAKKEARQEAESIINKARTEIERERNKIVDELRKEFVDVVVTAAEKVLRETLDKEKHRRVIEEVLKESSTFKKG